MFFVRSRSVSRFDKQPCASAGRAGNTELWFGAKLCQIPHWASQQPELAQIQKFVLLGFGKIKELLGRAPWINEEGRLWDENLWLLCPTETFIDLLGTSPLQSQQHLSCPGWILGALGWDTGVSQHWDEMWRSGSASESSRGCLCHLGSLWSRLLKTRGTK